MFRMTNEAACFFHTIHLFHGAGGSTSEVQSQLYIALDLCYVSQEEFDDLYKRADEVVRLISGFIRYLKEGPDS